MYLGLEPKLKGGVDSNRLQNIVKGYSSSMH